MRNAIAHTKAKPKSERVKVAEQAIKYHRMPQYTLTDEIRFERQSYPKSLFKKYMEETYGKDAPDPFGRMVYIPFSHAPIDVEVRAVATNLAHFVSDYAGVPCSARKISNSGYSVVPTAELDDILSEGYGVAKGLIETGLWKSPKEGVVIVLGKDTRTGFSL